MGLDIGVPDGAALAIVREARPRLAQRRGRRHLQRHGPGPAPRRDGGPVCDHHLADAHHRRREGVARHGPRPQRVPPRSDTRTRTFTWASTSAPATACASSSAGGVSYLDMSASNMSPSCEPRRHRHLEPVVQRLARPVGQDRPRDLLLRSTPMNKMQMAWVAAALSACAACTNGQAEVDVTADHVATFPGARRRKRLAGIVMTTDAVVTIDAHDELSSLGDVGTVHTTIAKNSVIGSDLAFVQHIRATIVANDGTMPEVLLSDTDVPANATEVALPLAIGDEQVASYLGEGKANVHLELTGYDPRSRGDADALARRARERRRRRRRHEALMSEAERRPRMRGSRADLRSTRRVLRARVLRAGEEVRPDLIRLGSKSYPGRCCRRRRSRKRASANSSWPRGRRRRCRSCPSPGRCWCCRRCLPVVAHMPPLRPPPSPPVVVPGAFVGAAGRRAAAAGRARETKPDQGGTEPPAERSTHHRSIPPIASRAFRRRAHRIANSYTVARFGRSSHIEAREETRKR